MWRVGGKMKTKGKIDFGTEQETITVFYIFSSELFINLEGSSCIRLRVQTARDSF